jgi:DNA-binding MarR family transcriptional regulator
MADATGFEEDEWRLWRSFTTMHRRLSLALDRQLQRDAGISQADFGVLITIFDSPDRRLRVGELAAALAWEKSRVSHQVSRMETRGLLERTTCPDDGRATWISLTHDGRRTVLGAIRGHAAAIRELFLDQLGDAGERTAIAGASQRILDALEPSECDLTAVDDEREARASA